MLLLHIFCQQNVMQHAIAMTWCVLLQENWEKKTAVVMCCVLLSCISILFDNSLATAVDLYHLTRLILSLTRGMNLFSCLFLLSFPSVLLLTCMRHKMWSISCRTCYSSMKIRKNVYLLPFKHPSFLIMNGNETKRLLDPVIDWFLLTRMFHKLFKSLSFSLVSSSISWKSIAFSRSFCFQTFINS